MRNLALFRDFAADLLQTDATRRGLPPLALAVAGAAFEGVGLMLLVPIIAVLGDGSAVSSPGGGAMSWLTAHLPAGKLPQLVALVALFGILMLLRSIIVVARDVSFARMNGAFLERTRTRVLDGLVTAGWSRIAGLHHGRVTHLLSADFHACGLAGTSFINLCLSGIMLVILLLVALVLSPLLAATALLFLVLLAAILYPTLVAARRSGAALVELSLKLTSDLSQFLAGLKPALGNNLGRQLLAHIARLQHDQVLHTVAFARQQSLSRAAITVAAGAIGALALLVGGLVLDVSGPKLLAMLVVLARLGGPALQFQQSLQMLLHTLPTYERIKALEADLPPAGGALQDADPTPLPSGPIRFDGVTYLHGENGRSGGGVRALDLDLAQGEMVAIIGASGAGKTTLADLMAGLIVPQDGAIRVGGAALTPANADQWRNAIAYVPQDSFLLNDTIRHNLLWGGALASEDELESVLKTVGADAVVGARSQGLEAPVGERGILLSGGERQRLALARALLRRPRLIILDEATNALDPETEERIVARLAALPDRPTIVAISHRATMLDRFDRVYRMEEGRLG